MALGKEEIENRWGRHTATDDTASDHDKVRHGFSTFVEFLDEFVPDGRAKSLALTKLQEASMWSNFAIAEQAPLVADSDSPALPKD